MNPQHSTPHAQGAARRFVRVKICGITRPEDALAAEEAGADAVGFVFAAGSKRQVSPELAADLSAVLGPFVARVGVFLNASQADIENAVRTAGLTAVQLHGDEDAGFARQLAATLGGTVKVIRAVSFDSEVTPASLADYPADAILLDASVPGSGQTFQWQAATAWRQHPRMVLAGGLNPENVATAVAALEPFGVDVSSGVETGPGIKSADLISRFVAAARGATG